MRSSADLGRFMREVVPFIIHSQLVNQGTLRTCGSASRLFEHFAKKRGFKAVTASCPGHFFNVVRTSDATWEVDLTHIQFSCLLREPDPDEGEAAFDKYEKKFRRVMDRLIASPFDAVKITRIGGPEHFDRHYAGLWVDQSSLDPWYQDLIEDMLTRYKRRGYRRPRHWR